MSGRAETARLAGERFYRAFLAGDAEAMADVVGANAAWTIPAGTVLSGTHRGPAGIAALRGRIAKLTGGTWQPLRDDSADVAASEWHAVVMDRFVATRSGRKLDSHEAVVLAVEDGVIVRLFHYLHDPAGFAEFWAEE